MLFMVLPLGVQASPTAQEQNRAKMSQDAEKPQLPSPSGPLFLMTQQPPTGSPQIAEPGEVSDEPTVGDSDQHLQYQPLIQNDAVVFALLMLLLGLIFYTSSSRWKPFRTFYKVVPMLLLCYFLPSLLTTFRIVNPEKSQIYFVASRYLLPASLVLLTVSIDLKQILRLGPKALVMFFTGTIGVLLGGPFAIWLTAWFAPGLVGGQGPEAVWRGFATVAGSWIGGGANQAAMFEIFQPSRPLYSVMVTIDVLVAEVWMLFLLLGVGQSDKIDRWFRADNSSIKTLQKKMEKWSAASSRIPSATDLMVVLAVAFGITGTCHWLADNLAPQIERNFTDHFQNQQGEIIDPVDTDITDEDLASGKYVQIKSSIGLDLARFSLDSKFFWLIVLATTFGLAFSFTRLRKIEHVGASKIGTVFIFILVASIGLKMDVRAIAEYPGLFLVGAIWMLFHVGLLFLVGYLVRAPYFFLAVGSKANIGGAASAPVVAAAFHPSLAPVGVLLAVLGYALGTYGAWLCAILMSGVAPS